MAEISTYEAIRRRKKQLDSAMEGRDIGEDKVQADMEKNYMNALEEQKKKDREEEGEWSIRNVIKRIRRMKL